jgi:hypothetical protein
LRRHWPGLIADADTSHLAVFDTGRPFCSSPAQITLNGLLEGLIKVDALRFEGARLYTELAADAPFPIDVRYAPLLIQEHGDLFLGTGIIARMIRTMLAGIYMMLHQNGISFQIDTSQRRPRLAFMNQSADNFTCAASGAQGNLLWILNDASAIPVSLSSLPGFQ